METIRFCLNDAWLELSSVPPTTTLLRYLRDSLSLNGTKEGCAEGDCGACTVVIAEPTAGGALEYRAINSCLVLLPMLQGKHVYSVEALKKNGVAHPVQEALVRNLGSQCGYCTPGVAMAMFEACYRSDLDAPWKVDAQMCGNLCRCTGYRPIRQATEEIAGKRPKDDFSNTLAALKPPDMALTYAAGPQRYENPTTFDALWDLLDGRKDVRLVNGGTDLSLEVTKRFVEHEHLVSLEGIAELRTLERRGDVHVVGAGVNLSDLEKYSERALPALAKMLHYFGARAIKNRATVGGNVCTASPIGDLAPVFLASGATFVLRSRAGERRVSASGFFLSYRKTALAPGEILAAVEVPHLEMGPVRALESFKVSKRRELDISTVSACFLVERGAKGEVTAARLAFGGMAATPARAKSAEAVLVGNVVTPELVRRAADALATDFQPLSDHRGSSRYRGLVARNLLKGFLEDRVPGARANAEVAHAS